MASWSLTTSGRDTRMDAKCDASRTNRRGGGEGKGAQNRNVTPADGPNDNDLEVSISCNGAPNASGECTSAGIYDGHARSTGMVSSSATVRWFCTRVRRNCMKGCKHNTKGKVGLEKKGHLMLSTAFNF